jgi:hypothetical protein
MFDRRAFLKVGSLSFFGSLAWGDVLAMRAEAAEAAKRDISVIHVLLSGGMSHVDTLDMKPDTRSAFRSIFKPIETNVPGIQVCDRLPLLAKQADKFTIIRSATHKNAVHEKASYLITSGHEPLATVNHPSMGSVISKELGARNELPPYTSIPGMTGLWESAGVLPGKYGPFETGDPNRPDFTVRDIRLPMGVDWARMERRRSLLAIVDDEFRQHDASGMFDTVDSFYQTAYNLVRSPAAKKAFALDEEPEALRERYGRTSMGQGALFGRPIPAGAGQGSRDFARRSQSARHVGQYARGRYRRVWTYSGDKRKCRARPLAERILDPHGRSRSARRAGMGILRCGRHAGTRQSCRNTRPVRDYIPETRCGFHEGAPHPDRQTFQAE